MDVEENLDDRRVVILMVCCCFLSELIDSICDWNFFMHLGSDFSFMLVSGLAHILRLLCLENLMALEPNYTERAKVPIVQRNLQAHFIFLRKANVGSIYFRFCNAAYAFKNIKHT